MYSKELIARFWSKVNKQGPYPHKKACKRHPKIKGTRCWEWTASCRTGGYGQINVGNNKIVSAHRFAYEIVNNKKIKEDELCHKCDNEKCVRPSHLFEGTHQANATDMKLKGRGAGPGYKGEDHGMAKLTEKQVLKIRKLFATGLFTKVQLGIKFKVTDSMIRRIVQRKAWSHI